MVSRRFAGRVAWRRPGWLPGQAARRGLRTFWASPSNLETNRGPDRWRLCRLVQSFLKRDERRSGGPWRKWAGDRKPSTPRGRHGAIV